MPPSRGRCARKINGCREIYLSFFFFLDSFWYSRVACLSGDERQARRGRKYRVRVICRFVTIISTKYLHLQLRGLATRRARHVHGTPSHAGSLKKSNCHSLKYRVPMGQTWQRRVIGTAASYYMHPRASARDLFGYTLTIILYNNSKNN